MPERLVASPGQTVGPFFHFALAYERCNELVSAGSPGAVRLEGTVYDGAGNPVPDALLELRQTDSAGNVPMVEGSIARGGRFTGWGRASTDSAGRYWFSTLEPGPAGDGRAAYFSVVVFARGLLNRLFTRAYLPGSATDHDAFLLQLPADRRATLVTLREPEGLRFDIHLQGPAETVFLSFPGHGER